MKIQLKVIPRSAQNSIQKIDSHHYKMKITALPEKGKANKQVIELLAKHFKVSKNQVKILQGTTIPDKLIEINLD